MSTITAPDNIGVLALEVYFPATFVRQDDLERHDGVQQGKYTAGLGQQGLAFCTDREDAVSMAMSALRQLLDKHNITPASIGRLEVATESSVDASKSIRTFLMEVLQHQDPTATDIDGSDCVQACHGGSVALHNAVNWMESRAWDGRLAVVVATDVALYAPGPARPTSGAGAVALVIGPNSPLVLERGLSSSHMVHEFDFYKPLGGGMYPHVDGTLSIKCYLQCLEACRERYAAKFETTMGEKLSLQRHTEYVLFHHPYNKLVQKAFTKLMEGSNTEAPTAVVAQQYKEKVAPGTAVNQWCGNMYTASLWASLAQLVENKGSQLKGCRILMFSYGSGAAATMFSLQGRSISGPYSLSTLSAKSDIGARLAARPPSPPSYFDQIVKVVESRYGAAGYCPDQSTLQHMAPGSYYLVEVDAKYRRRYAKKKAVPGIGSPKTHASRSSSSSEGCLMMDE